MVDRDQIRPLASAPDLPSSDDGEAATHMKEVRHKKCIKCCCCITTLMIIILVAVIVILAFTVFRVKDPVIKMNGVTVTKLELINGTTPKPGSNMSLIADVSVKNPNVASFKYSNTTTSLYYHGTMVGEARGPSGRAKAHGTVQMNMTVDIITDRILSSPNLSSDVRSGTLTMSSYSRIGGRFNVLNIIKKHVIIKMNCFMTVNISTQAIQEQKCKRKVDL